MRGEDSFVLWTCQRKNVTSKVETQEGNKAHKGGSGLWVAVSIRCVQQTRSQPSGIHQLTWISSKRAGKDALSLWEQIREVQSFQTKAFGNFSLLAVMVDYPQKNSWSLPPARECSCPSWPAQITHAEVCRARQDGEGGIPSPKPANGCICPSPRQPRRSCSAGRARAAVGATGLSPAESPSASI